METLHNRDNTNILDLLCYLTSVTRSPQRGTDLKLNCTKLLIVITTLCISHTQKNPASFDIPLRRRQEISEFRRPVKKHLENELWEWFVKCVVKCIRSRSSFFATEHDKRILPSLDHKLLSYEYHTCTSLCFKHTLTVSCIGGHFVTGGGASTLKTPRNINASIGTDMSSSGQGTFINIWKAYSPISKYMRDCLLPCCSTLTPLQNGWYNAWVHITFYLTKRWVNWILDFHGNSPAPLKIPR